MCGNIGHWLDLFVHILYWRSMPEVLNINLTFSDKSVRDDNVVIAISSNTGDLCSIMLSSRSEPFEGINESINFQSGDLSCKIDDFRLMTLWDGESVHRRRFWPKDPGHCRAIAQPFTQHYARNWQEVVDSTLLMLHITEMVRSGITSSEFFFSTSRRELSRAMEYLV